MIESFKHKGLKRLYEKGDKSKLPPDMVDRISRILLLLDQAETLETLDLPAYKLHRLTGNRRGQWSLSVQAQWRIVFKFEDAGAYDVDFVDYH